MKVHKRRESGNAEKLEVVFEAHGQRRHVKGKVARTLLALVKAGEGGVTALEVSAWAYRLAAYCYHLRHLHHLAIETKHEDHVGGWHGRHVLHTPVNILRVISTSTRAQ